MISYRMNRLFNPDSGRCLDVAVDHGFFGEPSFLSGIENIHTAVATLVGARPDAIQLSPGQAPVLQTIPGRHKPALVMRTDIANVYGSPLDTHLFSLLHPDAVEQALRLDAACVVVNLLQLPGRPEVREACIANIMALRQTCTQYGMPLMIEPLVMQDNTVAGGYMVDGDTAKIVALVRQARELGADIIKADPTNDIDDYYKIIETAGGVPVLVRGGGRVDDIELLQRSAALLSQGASGLVYGRNIIQHPRPAAITGALMSLLHDEAGLDSALAILETQR
ncbi:hypothetical protein [Nocardia sp. NPDC051463]|uniref:class I fructose-bisphosphate aldolase n=1 Tax=Nocardia sp. NPDC051463 TaxID=3154845 RepID=UPI00344C673C